MKVLILGTSGSGKTFLSKKFQKAGRNAFDADELDELHGWYDWEKKKVPFPKDAGKEFLENHEFLWDRKFLKNLLKKNPNIYLFGHSGNIPEISDLFDKIYFLKVPAKILIKRLDHKTRKNPMGKTIYQKKIITEWAKKNEKEAKVLGAEFIDGTLTPEKILKLIF